MRLLIFFMLCLCIPALAQGSTAASAPDAIATTTDDEGATMSLSWDESKSKYRLTIQDRELKVGRRGVAGSSADLTPAELKTLWTEFRKAEAVPLNEDIKDLWSMPDVAEGGTLSLHGTNFKNADRILFYIAKVSANGTLQSDMFMLRTKWVPDHQHREEFIELKADFDAFLEKAQAFQPPTSP